MAKAHKDNNSKSSVVTGIFKASVSANYRVMLSLYYFEEDEHTIAYCPALDLSGYGQNEDAAGKDFMGVLEEYFTYTVNKNTLKSDLIGMGWIIKKSAAKPMIAPKDEEIMRTNKNFNKIVNDYPHRKINTPVQIPAFA